MKAEITGILLIGIVMFTFVVLLGMIAFGYDGEYESPRPSPTPIVEESR